MTEPGDNVLPLAVLAAGRPCLVVGAGKTGTRKAVSLMEVGAQVLVVAPSATNEVRSLAEEGRITWISETFREELVGDQLLAFAATNDPEVNNRVLTACRNSGVLCGIVDRGWKDGDVISPATFHQDGLTVAVSTGGRSCRRSRIVKESLSRHIDSVSSADLMVLGTSHEQLPLEKRERFHLADARRHQAGAMLTQVWGVHEFALLNTCNRVELHCVVSDQPQAEMLIARILGFDSLQGKDFYVLREFAAFRHTSLLLAGLLSQTPGENHIVAQVKEATAKATSAGWTGSIMKEWMDSALHVSKDIRRATQPLLRHCEIEDLCLDYLSSECESSLHGGFMVLGSGVVGRGVIDRFLKRYPALEASWCYRRQEPDVPSSWRDRIELRRLDRDRSSLAGVHVLVCATASPDHILDESDVPFLDGEREVRIVDLSVPRNVAPEVATAPNITVADLDDLKHWYRREAADLDRIREMAAGIADEHKDMYLKLVRGLKERG